MNSDPETTRRQARRGVAALRAEVERLADCDLPCGSLHTNGVFLHLVLDSETGDYLAPVYSTAFEQIVSATRRLDKVAQDGRDPWGDALMEEFRPFPELAIQVSPRSPVVAIIDSGVLPDHPLLSGRVLDAVDMTGEGIEDRSGHGTIQAIRQAWHEPRAKLVIVKAFGGPNQRPTMRSFALALEYLAGLPGLGYVFVAGGVDARAHPQARLICQMADQLVDVHDLAGCFVATQGNIGDAGHWCPAQADQVLGITVADNRSMLPGAGPAGGLAVLQAGQFTSFPDIQPVPLGSFHIDCAERLRAAGLSAAAVVAVRQAVRYDDVRAAATVLEAGLLIDSDRSTEALPRLQYALREPLPGVKRGLLLGLLGRALLRAGRRNDAIKTLTEACEGDVEDAAVVGDYAELLETAKRYDDALGQYTRATDLDPRSMDLLEGFAWRRFYSDLPDSARPALQLMLQRDPTHAVARYNLAMIDVVSGDVEAAQRHLAEYVSQLTSSLSTSIQLPDAEQAGEWATLSDDTARRLNAEFILDGGRADHREFNRVARLIGLRGADWHGGPSVPTSDGSLPAFTLTARRLMLQPRSTQHAVVAAGLARAVTDAPPNAALVDALHALAWLYIRDDDADAADAVFARAAEVAKNRFTRRRARILVDAARLAAMRERWSDAVDLLERVYETEIILPQERIGNHATAGRHTYIVPAAHAVRALLALSKGDREAAMIETQMLLEGQPTDVEAALAFAVAWSPDNFDAADIVLRRLFGRARSDPLTRAMLSRCLEDFPFYNQNALPGTTVTAAFHDTEALIAETEVKLAAYPDDPQDRFYADVARALRRSSGRLRMAVIGGAVDPGAPGMTGMQLEVLELVESAPVDHTATRHTIRLLAALGYGKATAEVHNAIVVRAEGGTIDNFGRALLWAAKKRVDVILTPLAVATRHTHLLGLIRNISAHTPIVTAPTLEERGQAFPGLVEQLVTKAALPPPFPSQFVMYAHPKDFPDGFILREWLLTPSGALAGDAWSASSPEALQDALPVGVEMISGPDPSEPTIVGVWM